MGKEEQKNKMVGKQSIEFGKPVRIQCSASIVGKKVLLIDADPQGSLTISLGFSEPDRLDYSLANAMMKIINDEEVDIKEGILHHEEGVDVLPGNIELSGLEI